MRIAVDAMGGDQGLEVIARGAIEAATIRPGKLGIALVGDEEGIRSALDRIGAERTAVDIIHAPEIISMSDPPAVAVRRKKNASIPVAVKLLKEGKVDAFVSAGNTGAVVASSLMTLGRIHGVSRPAITTFMPNQGKGAVVLDVGANYECTPKHLFHFANMGTVFAEHHLGIDNPRVGILNIGEEPSKGNELVREAYKILQNANLNFIGNVEGRDVFSGAADVVVCDGFVGNVALKLSESIISFLTHVVKQEIKKRYLAKIGAMFMKGAFSSVRSKLDYAEYGGAPLLGVNGVIIISHGKSSSRAIKNAILVAERFVEQDVNKHIEKRFKGIVNDFAKVT
ncbi:MAG: phosphate acyltransferase PlsX [Candidatus Latescibacterota bacterium]